MIRYLDYGLCLDEGQELYLVRRMTLAEGRVEGEGEAAFVEPGERFLSHHRYVLKNAEHKIRLTPEQLALLRAAIDEMLRMRGQHADALTDGAEQQIPEPEPLLQTVCGDPFVEAEGELHGVALALLRGLEKPGEALLRTGGGPDLVWESNGNYAPYTPDLLNALQDRDLVVFSATLHPVGTPYYKWRCRLTGKGRALLAAQEPEPNEAEPESYSEADLTRFLDRGWVAVTDETRLRPEPSRQYGITEEGRRALEAADG